MKMDNLHLTIDLKAKDTLRGQFPQEKSSNHISLKLIGRLGDDDIRFLSGYSTDAYVDDDTGEVLYYPQKSQWKTIDLDISEVNPENLKLSDLNEIKGLRSIILPNGLEHVSWWYLLDDANINTSSLVVSEGTKTISNDSFCNWKILNNVSLPSTLTKISPDAFVGCDSLQTFNFPKGSQYFVVCDGVLFSSDKKILIAFPPALKIEKYEIPEGTSVIAERAFKQNSYLEEIVIPASVVRIQDFAFENCASLEWIGVHSENHFYYSRHGILYEKDVPALDFDHDEYSHSHLDKIICVPAALNKNELSLNNVLLAPRCFSGCRNIKSIKYEHCFHRIDCAFDGKNDIEEISFCLISVLPNFYDCQALKKLNIIGSFSGELGRSIPSSKNLQEINLEDNEDYIIVDGVVFTRDWELIFYPPQKKDKKYNAPQKVKSIRWNAFEFNPFLRDVKLPPSFDLEKLKHEWIDAKSIDGSTDVSIETICNTNVRLSLTSGN